MVAGTSIIATVFQGSVPALDSHTVVTYFVAFMLYVGAAFLSWTRQRDVRPFGAAQIGSRTKRHATQCRPISLYKVVLIQDKSLKNYSEIVGRTCQNRSYRDQRGPSDN